MNAENLENGPMITAAEFHHQMQIQKNLAYELARLRSERSETSLELRALRHQSQLLRRVHDALCIVWGADPIAAIRKLQAAIVTLP
jgi:hypothetical protein